MMAEWCRQTSSAFPHLLSYLMCKYCVSFSLSFVSLSLTVVFSIKVHFPCWAEVLIFLVLLLMLYCTLFQFNRDTFLFYSPVFPSPVFEPYSNYSVSPYSFTFSVSMVQANKLWKVQYRPLTLLCVLQIAALVNRPISTIPDPKAVTMATRLMWRPETEESISTNKFLKESSSNPV